MRSGEGMLSEEAGLQPTCVCLRASLSAASDRPRDNRKGQDWKLADSLVGKRKLTVGGRQQDETALKLLTLSDFLRAAEAGAREAAVSRRDDRADTARTVHCGGRSGIRGGNWRRPFSASRVRQKEPPVRRVGRLPLARR